MTELLKYVSVFTFRVWSSFLFLLYEQLNDEQIHAGGFSSTDNNDDDDGDDTVSIFLPFIVNPTT